MMNDNPAYKNDSLATSKRVDDLLKRMTLDEKVGQLIGMWVGTVAVASNETLSERLEERSLEDVKDAIRGTTSVR